MPVEERLRTALADLADQVRVDAERPLQDVRRRRQRRVSTVWAGIAAAVVALVAGMVAVAPQPTQRPEPADPPTVGIDTPPRTIPFGTYARTVTDDEALDAGYPREAVDVLFGGAGRARAELVFRDKKWVSEQEGWGVWFVDAQGERRNGFRGYYYPTGAVSFEHDGELVLVGTAGAWEVGGYHVFDWELEAGSLVLERIPKKTDRPTPLLLGEGTWERQ